jgi:hypothetical protein
MTKAPKSETAQNVDAIQRRARIGDKLITKGRATSGCSGFGLVEEPDVPVYLSPGTELAFDKDIHCYHRFNNLRFCNQRKTAKFRHLPGSTNSHEDAVELADGRLVMVAELAGGQTATVTRVPPSAMRHHRKG